MKINAFMTMYKTRKREEEKLKAIKEHIKYEYVPFETKADVAKAIVRSCYWDKEENDAGTERDVFHINSVAKHMLCSMAIIDLYTDLERQKKDGKMLEDFNLLNGSGVLDLIIQNMDQRELKEFNMVLQMTCDDAIANEYENHAFISHQVERFGKLIGTALSPVLSQLDIGQIAEIIKNIK